MKVNNIKNFAKVAKKFLTLFINMSRLKEIQSSNHGNNVVSFVDSFRGIIRKITEIVYRI